MLIYTNMDTRIVNKMVACVIGWNTIRLRVFWIFELGQRADWRMSDQVCA